MSSTTIQDPELVEIVSRTIPLLLSSCENNNKISSSLCFSVKFILKHINRIIVSNHHDDHDDNNQTFIKSLKDAKEFSSQPFDPEDKHSWESICLSLQTLGFRNKRSQDSVLRKLEKYVDDKIKDHYRPSDRNNRVGPGIMGRHVEVSMIINRVTVDRVSIPMVVQNRHYEHQVGPTTPADKSVCGGSLKRVRVEELTSTDGLEKKDEVCSICIEELAKEEEVTCLPCDHAFHGARLYY